MREDTLRTKKLVRVWALLPPDAPMDLDYNLDPLRPGQYPLLRQRVNDEFLSKDGNFPVSTKDWTAAQGGLVKVVHLRDFIRARLKKAAA